MEKGFTITLDELKPNNITIDEFIALAGHSLQIALRTAYNSLVKDFNDNEKELRAALYDRLIIITTEIAQDIYPEYTELYSKTPEALLEELDRKAKELDAKNAKQKEA